MTPREQLLGYGYVCPFCLLGCDEGQQTGVYYFKKPVCARCAPVLSAARAADQQPEAGA